MLKASSFLTSVALALMVANASAFAGDPIDVDPTNPVRQIIHLCEVDGTPIRPLIKNLELRRQLDRQGTPDISADGKWVSYDAWSTARGEDWSHGRIIVAKLDGSAARDICDGVVPSFSPDGSRIAVSRPSAPDASGMSIWVMNSDGTEREMIADRGAWGARWSPDGESLAFVGGTDKDGNRLGWTHLRLYDFKTESIRDLFTAEESPFSKVNFHLDWEKSGRRIAFSGTLKSGGPAMAVINADGGLKTIKYVDEDKRRGSRGGSFDWPPYGDQLLVTARLGGRQMPQTLKLHPFAEVYTFNGFPENVHVTDAVFSPDGERLIAAFRAIPGE